MRETALEQAVGSLETWLKMREDVTSTLESLERDARELELRLVGINRLIDLMREERNA